MTDLRKDPLFDRWVLVAEHRSQRPNDYTTLPATTEDGVPRCAVNCPFCPSPEKHTPPAVYSACNAEGDWQVRVVPNKYPAVGTAVGGDESGVHEVVIESPRHIQNTADLTPRELADVLEAYDARLRHWHHDGRFEYATIFKNVHSTAGASLVHLHSQIMVLPEAPPPFLRELRQLDRFRREHDQCALCERIARERIDSVRLVLDRDGYVAICPYVSLHAYETWILPVDHDCWFPPAANRVSTNTLASVLGEVVSRIERLLPGVGYNVILRVAPWGAQKIDYHPRIEIRPRLDALAGLELGNGIHINQVSPEYAAQKLRALEPHCFCGT